MNLPLETKYLSNNMKALNDKSRVNNDKVCNASTNLSSQTLNNYFIISESDNLELISYNQNNNSYLYP